MVRILLATIVFTALATSSFAACPPRCTTCGTSWGGGSGGGGGLNVPNVGLPSVGVNVNANTPNNLVTVGGASGGGGLINVTNGGQNLVNVLPNRQSVANVGVTGAPSNTSLSNLNVGAIRNGAQNTAGQPLVRVNSGNMVNTPNGGGMQVNLDSGGGVGGMAR